LYLCLIPRGLLTGDVLTTLSITAKSSDCDNGLRVVRLGPARRFELYFSRHGNVVRGKRLDYPSLLRADAAAVEDVIDTLRRLVGGITKTVAFCTALNP